MRYSYRVITQHGIDRTVRISESIEGDDYDATWDAARAYAESLSPENNGDICPNVDEELVKPESYEQGMFWYGNRYAIIINNRPIID
jgi:hypothetical protein